MSDDGAGPGGPTYGPASPLEPAARYLGAPLTRGFAAGLVALNLVALGWMWARQDQQLAHLRVAVNEASFSGTASYGGVGSADPELCWLLGVIANGQGKGSVVAGMASGTDSMTDCQTYAMRGARGQGPSGN